jgi:hypothetical protein
LRYLLSSLVRIKIRGPVDGEKIAGSQKAETT